MLYRGDILTVQLLVAALYGASTTVLRVWMCPKSPKRIKGNGWMIFSDGNEQTGGRRPTAVTGRPLRRHFSPDLISKHTGVVKMGAYQDRMERAMNEPPLPPQHTEQTRDNTSQVKACVPCTVSWQNTSYRSCSCSGIGSNASGVMCHANTTRHRKTRKRMHTWQSREAEKNYSGQPLTLH